jgi:hypothetical protein
MSRRAGRFLPSSSVTVALLEENLPVAYGVVKDLSEAGACIMTNAVLRPGKSYQFRMSFFGGEVLEAQAKVVWNETTASGASGRSEVPHGLEFTDMHGPHLDHLRRILQSSGFGSKNSH